ncbi:MAG: prephenate dehydrogenase [Christensenellaceae bacterium]|jgi:prephenate dehydrogenase
MKKIAVIGLGIIGSSICRALRKAGCFVAGSDLDGMTLSYAKNQGYIQEEAENFTEYDAVFLAVPPRAAIALLESAEFKEGTFVADVCGIKAEIERAVFSAPRRYRYIGLHPMAGKETSGILSSSEEMFDGANLVVVVSPKTEKSAIEEALAYAKLMNFGRITECSAEEHDKKIALTSQLAHLVSSAYVKSPSARNCEGFTGGSFQDMTRIAGVDERIWSQLYLYNRFNILAELDGLIENLKVYRDAIFQGDERSLSAELKTGRLLREEIKSGKE